MSTSEIDDHPEAAPAGEGSYVVRRGDSLTAIAEEHGHFWQTIWDHPPNEHLATLRKNPHVLLPGDRLTIPPIRPKTAECETGKRHTFRRKGIPARIRFVLRGPEGEPLAGKRYELVWETGANQLVAGTTDADGGISHYIATTIKRATLRIWPEHPFAPEVIEREVEIGTLEPVASLSGIRARLDHLGFPCGEGDGPLDDATRTAIRMFERAHGLPETGEIGESLRAELSKRHGM